MVRTLNRMLQGMAILIAIPAIVVLIANPRIPVTITEEQIDAALAQALPFSTGNAGFQINATEIDVDTKDGDRISLNGSGDFDGLTLRGSVAVRGETSIHYRNGKFYLSDLTSENISVDLTAESTEALRKYRDAAATFLSRSDAPTGEPTSQIDAAARENVAAASKRAIDWLIRSTPIYTIDQDKWWARLAALAIADVKITRGEVTVVLEPRKVLISVLLTVAVLLLMAARFWFLFSPIFRRR
ncbi:MAG: hypothetical protein AAGJ28_06770 [Pseudomonadota bacterium]